MKLEEQAKLHSYKKDYCIYDDYEEAAIKYHFESDGSYRCFLRRPVHREREIEYSAKIVYEIRCGGRQISLEEYEAL